jgi:hypothetical protein
MIHPRLPLALALALALPLGACAADVSLLPADLDDGVQGKADAAARIERIPADAPLGGAALKRLVCDAIGPRAAGSKCGEFRFRITEFARSTLYLHADDGEPVTLELAVRATHSGGDVFEATLRRDRLVEHQLAWSATATPEGGDHRAAILAIAEELGEFADWGSIGDRAVPVARGELPGVVIAAFDDLLEDRIHDNKQTGEDNTAFFREEAPFHELREAGDAIGYAVEIDDFIDHPLWDGSGVVIYVEVDGTVVADVEWSG